MNPQRLMHLLDDMLIGISPVTSAAVSIFAYALLAFEAHISRLGGHWRRERCRADRGAGRQKTVALIGH